MKYEECKKIVTRIRFEKAIAVDESTKSVANQIEINTMSTRFVSHAAVRQASTHRSVLAVEKEYDGPHLEGEGRVTKDFMYALLPYFENQKKLHKKYAYQVRTTDSRMHHRSICLDYSTNSDLAENGTVVDRHHCPSSELSRPTGARPARVLFGCLET